MRNYYDFDRILEIYNRPKITSKDLGRAHFVPGTNLKRVRCANCCMCGGCRGQLF